MNRGVLVAMAALAVSACEDNPPPDATTAAQDAAVVVPDVDEDAWGPPPSPTTWADVQPVYQAYCGGCHGGQGSGQSNFATSYADTLKRSASCIADPRAGPPKTVARCVVDRVSSGTMPPSGQHIPDSAYQIMREFVIDGLLP